MKCIICIEEIEVEISGFSEGHNAEPIEEGRCCSDCNDMYVILARMKQLRQ